MHIIGGLGGCICLHIVDGLSGLNRLTPSDRDLILVGKLYLMVVEGGHSALNFTFRERSRAVAEASDVLKLGILRFSATLSQNVKMCTIIACWGPTLILIIISHIGTGVLTSIYIQPLFHFPLTSITAIGTAIIFTGTSSKLNWCPLLFRVVTHIIMRIMRHQSLFFEALNLLHAQRTLIGSQI